MSDLQCAATLLLCCAEEADYDAGAVSGSLTLAARSRARELGESLRSARLSTVYCSSLAPAVQTAEIAAAPSGVPVLVRDGLREQADRESPAEARTRVAAEVQSIVDEHRGETVLVVTHPAAVRSVVPPSARNLLDDLPEELPPGGFVEVAVDGDGWLVRSWSGERA